MRLVWWLSLMLFSPWGLAAIGITPSNFPDGLQSPYSGTAASKGVIYFDYNAQLLNNPDTVLAAKTVNRNNGSTLNTCSSAHCTASGNPAPVQDAGTFPSTGGYTATVDVGYQVSTSLAGNGTNQYKSITLGYQAQLTINSAGETFYIDQLTLDSSSILRLAPGDYWVRRLTSNFQSQIQVQGNGLVRLFVKDDWTLASSALMNSPAINSAGTPGNLYVFSYGSVTLSNQSTLSGYVYSANSQGSNDAITLQSPSYVFGALSGENISLGTDARVNFRPPVIPLTCLNDDFNRSSGLGSDWVVRGSNFTPTISGNRLRLTSASTNVAAMANLQRLLPAAGNLIQVQFRLYAYGGNGADGMAVVFSDASTTPQPGAFGGPLGYGTKGGANVGFAGGWLGVGLDEYGNFSNEGGPGSIGQRPDAVAVRGSGSGTTGYRYIAGTGIPRLDPGIDISGTTAGPGHLYRITLDGRTSGQVLLTVERDSGSGLQPLPNLSGINVRAATDQIAEPANFFLSLTGSTGSSTNIHELDDLQLCALQINPVGQQVDHYELSHAGTALTCNPLPVTVKACLDSAVPCATAYPASSPALAASLSPAGWSGLTFSNGVANAQLAVRTAGTVRMSVDSSTPPLKAFGQTWCKSGTAAWGTGSACDVAFADSGFNFIFDPSSSAANTPVSLLAAKQVSGTLQAVKKDALSPSCVPAFVGDRDISFSMGYVNPALGETSGISNQPVLLNGASVVHTAATSLKLQFDSTGSTPLTLRYDDAGQVSLSASYTGSATNSDAGLSMVSSTTLKSRPYGLCLQTASTCTAAGVGTACPPFPGGIRAGDNFALQAKAVAWKADGEARTAAVLCSAHNLTPKFRLTGIGLAQTLVEPVSGVAGAISPNNYSHALGDQSTANVALSEVGVFRLSAQPVAGSYLETESVDGGTSGLVGRFIPAYLTVAGSAKLKPSCGPASSSPFSYQGQPMLFDIAPQLTVSGNNRQGGITSNYDIDPFWRLPTPSRTDVAADPDDDYSSVTGKASLDAAGRLLRNGAMTTTTTGANNKDGSRTYSWTGESLTYAPALSPIADDSPFQAAISLGFSAGTLTDSDTACYDSSGCKAYSLVFGGSEVRLGRLRIGNAHGSELQGLTLPVALESWQSTGGGTFQLEGLDTCTTAAALGAVGLDAYTGNLAAGETAATSNAPSAGMGSLLLSAPGSGNDGSVQASYPAMPSWLYFTWDGSTRSAARGLASFGIYKGAAPLIYRRELYR